MQNKPTQKEINIITALGSDVSEQLDDHFKMILIELNSKLQLLADAKIIDCEEADWYKCKALHLAVDFLLDKEDEEIEQELSGSNKETERAY